MLLALDTTGVRDSLYFEQITQLEGREYLMRFLWSTREYCWYLSLYDQDQNPLALSIKLVVNCPLLRRFIDPRLPRGVLMVLDATGKDEEISDPIDLQPTGRFPLYYLTSDDEALT